MMRSTSAYSQLRGPGGARNLILPAFFASALLALALPRAANATIPGDSADKLLGQTAFSTTTANAGQGLSPFASADIAVDLATGRVYLSDTNNNRILYWNSGDFNGSAAPDGIIGQGNANARASGAGTTSLNAPHGIFVDASENLWVADTGNNRVVKYSATVSNGASNSLILGGTSGTSNVQMSSPTSVAVDSSGNVWVADTANNRVLKFNGTVTNGAAASIVVGQAGFGAALTGNTSYQMSLPAGVAVDNTSNYLWVADTGNNRILQFSPAPTISSAAANDVFGQSSFTSGGAATTAGGLSGPQGIAVDGDENLWVADSGNNRVVEFEFSFANNENAAFVLGQTNLTSGGSGDGTTQMYGPAGVAFDSAGDLFVADATNNRALEFIESSLDSAGTAATTIFTGVNASGVERAFNVSVDVNTGHVYAADTLNNRVLWWASIPSFANGQAAAGVLGQSNFTSAGPGNGASQLSLPNGVYADAAGNVWVSDTGNSRVVEFTAPVSIGENAAFVLGQTAFGLSGSGFAANQMSGPSAVGLDANNSIWVADTGNNRVLKFNAPPNNSSAALVLGQPAFTGNASGNQLYQMNAPKGLAIDTSGFVWVSDTGNNRVLQFTSPATNASASLFLTATTGPSMNAPAAIALDSLNDLWVADAGNNRVLGYYSPIANGQSPSAVLGQTNQNNTGSGSGASSMWTPSGVGLDAAGNIWVADTNNNRVTEFQTVPTGTAFGAFQVGISTLNFTWASVASEHYLAQVVQGNTCNFATPLASSITANNYAIFAGLNANSLYCFRVAGSDAGGDLLGTYSTGYSTATFAMLTSTTMGVVPPTEFASAGTPSYVHNNTFIFQGSTGAAAAPAQTYLSTWTQTAAYTFTGLETQFGGVNYTTNTATLEGYWYEHAAAENVNGVYNSTSTSFWYDYDATPSTASVFESFNSYNTAIPTGSWNNSITTVTMQITANDVPASGGSNASGFNTVGYSSGTSPAAIGLWHFDEPSGSRAFNFAPSNNPNHNNDGILTTLGSALPYSVPGRFGNALEFTPAALGFVNTAYGSSSDPLNFGGNASEATFEAWVKLNTSTGTEKYIVSRWDDGASDPGYLLKVTNTGPTPGRAAFFVALAAGGGTEQLISTASLPTGAWTHIAGIFDGDGEIASTPGVYLFVNGVMVSSAALANSSNLIANQSGLPTLIGAGFLSGTGVEQNVVTGVDNVFDGAIDEVRIFSNPAALGQPGTLQPADIVSDYDSGIGWTPYVLVSSNTGASWQLSQSSTTGSLKYSLPVGQGATSGTFGISGASLVTSASRASGSGGTDQAVFVMTDRAGNEMEAGPYAIFVDTTPPVGSTVTVISSSQGATGAITSFSTTSWSALANGLTVQFTLQDVTSGLDATNGHYSVKYSTGGPYYFINANSGSGNSPYVSFSAGAQGSTAPQTMTVYNLNLTQSNPDTGLGNSIIFISSDQATNQAQLGPFTVQVDSTPPGPVSTVGALTPYASGQIQLSWVSSGNNGATGNLYGAFDILYTTSAALAAASNSWTPATPQISIATATVAPGTTNTALISNLFNNGTYYYFRVFEQDPAGNFSALSAGATQATLAVPNPPTTSSDSVLGISSISFTWNQSSLTSTYDLYSYTDSNNFLTAVSTPTGSYVRTGLSPNTIYGLQVQSVNPAGGSTLYASDTDYTLAAVPGAPAISSVAYSSVTFSWNANGNPGYTDYEISQSADGFNTNFSTPIIFSNVWTSPSLTVINLSPGDTYYYRVRSENNQNNYVNAIRSTFSAVTQTETLPNTPSNLSGTASATTGITWTWNANGSGGATLFRVLSASAPVYLTQNLPISVTTFVEMDPSTNTAYGVAVEAYTPSGSGGLTQQVTVYTQAAVPGVPTLVSATTGSLTISWASNGNPGYTAYEASLTTDPNFVNNISTPIAFTMGYTTASATFTGLAAGTSYYYRLRAQNNDPVVVATTAFSGAGVSATLPVAVSGLTLISVSTDSAEWNWNSNGNGNATEYHLYDNINGQLYDLSALIGLVQSSTFTYPGLAPNNLYQLQVQAQTPTGTAAVTPFVGGYTLANPPGDVTVAMVSSGTVTLTWNAVENSTFTRYQVTYSSDAFISFSGTAVAFQNDMTSTTYTVGNLSPFTTYYFDVQAVNNVPPTAPPTAVPTAIPPIGFGEFMVSTFTEAPLVSGVKGYGLGTSSISWSWTPIPNTTQYNVYSASSSVLLLTTSATTFIETGLSTNAAYGIQLDAENFSGTGPLNAATMRYTHAAAPLSPVFSPVSSMTVTLMWDPQGNPTYTNYEVSDSTDGFVNNFSTPVAFSSLRTSTCATVSGLASGATYTFRVRAEDGYNVPTAFDVAQTTNTLGIPGTIANLSVNAFFPGELDLTWTQPGENGSTGFVPSALYYIMYSSVSASLLNSTSTAQSGVYSVVIGTPIAPGTPYSTSITGLSFGNTYYVSVFTENYEGVVGAGSNVVNRLAPGIVRAFTINTTYFAFPNATLGSSIVISTPSLLVSTGNVAVAFTFAASMSTSSVWQVAAATLPFTNGSSVPPLPENTVQLFGAFNPNAPTASNFQLTGDIDNISSFTVAASTSIPVSYSLSPGNQFGANVLPAIAPCYDVTVSTCQARTFWYEMNLPSYTTSASSQTIQITIGVQ